MSIRLVRSDVVVVGAGCAGMIAALEASRKGARVLLLDRGSIGFGTNSAISNGVFAGPSKAYSVEEYVADTLLAGKGLNKKSIVNMIADRALEAFSLLSSWGVEFAAFRGGYAVKSESNDMIRGLTLVKRLAGNLKNSPSIESVPRFYVTEIMSRDGSVSGVSGYDNSGRRTEVQAPAVILATGGAGALYLHNDNQRNMLGQSYYLAAKAGLRLWDMEFVQFYPLVLAQRGAPFLLVYPPYPKEARILNSSGEDILVKHRIGDPNEAIESRRDSFSAVLYEEGLQGPVTLDYTGVPASLYSKRPFTLLPQRKIDLARSPFPVSPAAHFFMGGVEVDENGETTLRGLFACGEIVWGFHGANRMRGNALTECAVTGIIAGRGAAEHASTKHGIAANGVERVESGIFKSSSKGIDLRSARQLLRDIAWKHAGVVRSEEGLSEGIRRVSELQNRVSGLVPSNSRDVAKLEDLKSGIFTLQTILETSILREESRGAFIRYDYGKTDDGKWRQNSCVTYNSQDNVFSVGFIERP